MIDGNHLYQFFLWKGRGQRGNTLELKDKIQNYGQLIIKLVFSLIVLLLNLLQYQI